MDTGTGTTSPNIWWHDEYYDYDSISKDPRNEESFLWNEPGIYRPVIILGATILTDSLKDKIKAKYIRAGPKDKQYIFDKQSNQSIMKADYGNLFVFLLSSLG